MVRGTLILLACLTTVPALARSRGMPPEEDASYGTGARTFEDGGYGAQCGAALSPQERASYEARKSVPPVTSSLQREGRAVPAKSERSDAKARKVSSGN